MDKPDIPVIPLREAAQLLGISIEAAKSALRHHNIHSGYPTDAVTWLATHRPGRGARTDLQPTATADPVEPVEQPTPADTVQPPTETAPTTVALVWETYDHTHTLITRSVPVPPDTDPTSIADIPAVRNARINPTPVNLGDVPTPQYGWDEGERNTVPLFPLPYTAQAVACPKCQQPAGMACTSTGGGNRATVATHRPRTQRVAGWTNAVQEHAALLVRTVSYHGWGKKDLFTVFEQAAAPIPVTPAKKLTPKGVQLSEKQAEDIERYVHGGGQGWLPSGHLSGDHQERQTGQALEAKGIIEFVRRDDANDRLMRLTPFGWQVYRQHRLILRHLSEDEVNKREAAAASSP